MAAKLGFELVKQAMLKLLMKKGDDGIVLTLPKNEIVDYNAKITMDRLIRNGIDPDSLTSPDQVINVLDNINNQIMNKARVISADTAEGKAITEKLFGKKGEVISFKDKIEAMKKSGDIVDPANLKKNDNVRTRELFRDANQRLKGPIKEKQDMGPFGKVDVETDYSSSINRPDFFDPKAKNMYGETVKTGVEFIQKEKERILNLINNKKKNMVPPTHSNYKLLKKSLQDQEDALEAIKVTEDLGGNENMFDFLRTQNIADYKAKPLQRSNYTKTDAEIKAEIEAGNKKGIESLKNKKDDPEGFYTGGIVDVEPSLDDIGHGSDALMARTRLVSPGNQATTSTGLNYLLAEDNDNMRVPFGSGGRYDYGSMQHKINSVNAAYKRYKKSGGKKLSFDQFAPIWAAENFAEGGRIGFAKGKLADAARRKFMKAAGATGAGIAALKTGLLGFADKAAPVVEKTAEAVSNTAGQVPPYFFKLVEKIKTLGDETLASQDKAIAKKYKDYVMEEDFAGNITIIKKGDDNLMMKDGDVYMSYKVDEVPVKGKKGSTKVEEYEEFTARPDAEGKMKDIEQGVPDEIIKEVEEGSGNVPESFYTGPNAIKKADGGRIGLFMGGGLTAGKSLLKNMLKFMSKDGSHKKSPAEILKMMNPKQFEKLLNNPKYQGQVSSEAPEGLDKIIQDMIGKTKTDRSDMVGDIISTSRKIKKTDDDIIDYKNKIIKDLMDRGSDRETAEQFAETLALQVSKAAGKKSTPKITEQGLLELENIQKNLVTKDRKLQAQGGLTTMLGE